MLLLRIAPAGIPQLKDLPSQHKLSAEQDCPAGATLPTILKGHIDE